MSAAGFDLAGVSLGYGRAETIAGLDLTVRPGEILVVFGKSGCGKTTLLRALAGLVPVGGGSLTFGGTPVTGPDGRRAMVFQEDALLPWRSVRRNVELPLRIAGVAAGQRRDRALELLARVGLSGYERHLPKQLSGGMRQRVQLARALVTGPRAILMDEPFGALDVGNRRAMQELLLEVWSRQPTTVVFVTHDLDEALLLGDRIAVLAGTPSALRTVAEVPFPRSPGSLADPAMAALRADLLASVGGVADESALVAS
jgi:NitT/TauT family transport system ATP-binding protein